jgi:nucleotide-binding universal stress UspA family protein
MLRKILVGIDSSPGARDAAVLAGALGAADDPDVLLLGAYTDPLLPFPPVLRRDFHLGEETEQLLLELRREHAPRARTHTLADLSPGRALCHAVEREHPDVLVLGSSHRVSAGHAGVGRTGRQVLHGAACPVALAAGGLHEAPFALRRVLVGIDSSPEAAAALELAQGLARSAGARLIAVAVVEDRLPATVAPAGMAIELVQWDELVAVKREQAERLVGDAGARVPRLRVKTRTGDPAEELAQAAVEADADLLVIGSRRWGPLARLVVGSTGEELVREAPCSLLLVPRPAETDAQMEQIDDK